MLTNKTLPIRMLPFQTELTLHLRTNLQPSARAENSLADRQYSIKFALHRIFKRYYKSLKAMTDDSDLDLEPTYKCWKSFPAPNKLEGH